MTDPTATSAWIRAWWRLFFVVAPAFLEAPSGLRTVVAFSMKPHPNPFVMSPFSLRPIAIQQRPSRPSNGFSRRMVQNRDVFQEREEDNGKEDVIEDTRNVPAPKKQARTQTEKNQLQERSQHQLWFVDDEEDICAAVGTFLQDAGYPVTTFAHGDQVWKQLIQCCKKNANNEQDEMPHILVSDVRMPIVDGITLLSRIRDDPCTAALPVVLLTAKGQTQDRIAGYQAGADAYLPKPFDPQELLSIVDNLVRTTQQLLRPPPAQVSVDQLRRDLQELKHLLLDQGGGRTEVREFVQKQTHQDDQNLGSDVVVFLPPDEQQVLEVLCQGKTNKEIAAQMYLSQRRIEQLLTHMFRKAGVKNRTELVRWAIGTGHVRM